MCSEMEAISWMLPGSLLSYMGTAARVKVVQSTRSLLETG
jgi:hypothetical protein